MCFALSFLGKLDSPACEDNIKMDLIAVDLEDVNWIHLTVGMEY
jgi:hypothetical protein